MMEITNEVNSNKFRLSMGLYLNYFVHGFALIILAQNMTSLAHSWLTTIAMVSYVISGVGIGRLIAYPISGFLADRFGRKTFVYLGMLAYLIFALGMAFTKQIWLAYLFAIFAGIANSLLDAGTYTTLVEINDGQGQGTVLLKAFMSAGEFILPMLVAFLGTHQLWYGWSFMVIVLILVLNALILFPVKFPKPNQTDQTSNTGVAQTHSARKLVMTGSLLGYGYTSMAVMILFTQWITLYAKDVLQMTEVMSHFLLSLYSIGSITGVLVLFCLLKMKLPENKLMLVLNILAVTSLLTILVTSNVFLIEVACVVFGFSAAGGVMQTGLTLFMKLYPTHRGAITGSFYFFGSLASFTIPIITGWLSKNSIANAFRFDFVIGILGLVLVIIMMFCSRRERG
ncbi:MFS transporter [Fructilactobacillus frigidiflavus]|uniref:MFS transporter n=1 Tax=Fructilactobacillus frigidiflavus TaxID=3242688 RepID=UPI003756F425